MLLPRPDAVFRSSDVKNFDITSVVLRIEIRSILVIEL
jgi:hypothetical protein